MLSGFQVFAYRVRNSHSFFVLLVKIKPKIVIIIFSIKPLIVTFNRLLHFNKLIN
jgi:hypothetical protein